MYIVRVALKGGGAMSAQPPWIWKFDGFQVLTGVWKEKIYPPVPCGQIPEYGPAHCLTIVMFGIHSNILMIALKEQQTNFKKFFPFFIGYVLTLYSTLSTILLVLSRKG